MNDYTRRKTEVVTIAGLLIVQDAIYLKLPLPLGLLTNYHWKCIYNESVGYK